MKILVLCDEGNNRSVTLASHLKYWGHDVLSAGLKRNARATLAMLGEWGDRIIVTDQEQERGFVDPEFLRKLDLWDIGPDHYPRPFNKELLAIVRRMMEEHKAEYKGAEYKEAEERALARYELKRRACAGNVPSLSLTPLVPAFPGVPCTAPGLSRGGNPGGLWGASGLEGPRFS
jgi:hypothetical protein